MFNTPVKFNPITNIPITNNNKDLQDQNTSRINRNSNLNNKSESNITTNNKNDINKQNLNENINQKTKVCNCKIHNLEIGGCCDNFECVSKQQIYCLKCIADPNFCIRNFKHEFIPIEEFISIFIERELFNLKNDNQYSKSFSQIKKFLIQEVEIKNGFLEKSRTIQDEINDYYCDLIDYIKSLLEDFNNKFEKFVNSKLSILTKNFENLKKLIAFEELSGFDKNKMIQKASKVNSDDLNNLILDMKKTVYNIKKKNCENDLDSVKYILDLNTKNENVFMIKKKFEEIKNELDQKHLSFSNNLDKNIFFSNKLLSLTLNNSSAYRNQIRSDKNYFEDTENSSLNNLSIFKEFTIDFSINSNFVDKKFLIFEHSNGNTYFTYPTSLYSIKLIHLNNVLKDEYFTFKDEENEIDTIKKSKENPQNRAIKQHNAVLIKSKDFERGEKIDKHLIYKLSSHGGKITHMKYFRLNIQPDQERDLLISASEDKSIKIWDISNLNKNYEDVNKQYKNLCVRTILPHDNNKICNLTTFFDPLKNKAFILSSGFGDRIKVWDMETGVINRELNDSTKAPNFDNEIIVFHENSSAKNFMVTSGHNSSVRIWDFDSGKIIKTFQHKEKIVDLLFFNNEKEKLNPKNKNYDYINNNSFYLPKIFIIDDNGKCVTLIIDKNEKLDLVFNLKPESVNTSSGIRNGGVKWNESRAFLYSKNGLIYEYDIDNMYDFFNSINANENFSIISNYNTNDVAKNNIRKILNSINISTTPISYCEKYKDLIFGDLLVVHSHDQKIRILKSK